MWCWMGRKMCVANSVILSIYPLDLSIDFDAQTTMEMIFDDDFTLKQPLTDTYCILS